MKEKYTIESTLQSIMENPRLKRRVLEFFNHPEQFSPDLPLKEILNTPDCAFNEADLQQFLWWTNIVATQDEEGDQNSILLWETPPLYQPESGGRPYLQPYLLDHKAPVVVVVPGGGYQMTAIEHEGHAMAQAYNAAGFHAVMLRYRVTPNYYPAPQMDLIRAIKMVRAHAQEWQIESDHLAVCGFSAGGHLSASVGGLYDKIKLPEDEYAHISAKPNALVLSYPVISFSTFAHVGSAESLLGPNNTEEQRQALSCEQMVTADYPPSFIWSCENDNTVPIKNSQMMAAACEQAGVPHELHIYPGGEHGVGLGIGLEAEHWFAASVEFLKAIFTSE